MEISADAASWDAAWVSLLPGVDFFTSRTGTYLLSLNGVSFKWMLLCVNLFGVLPVGCCNCYLASVNDHKCSNDG